MQRPTHGLQAAHRKVGSQTLVVPVVMVGQIFLARILSPPTRHRKRATLAHNARRDHHYLIAR